MKEVGGPAAAAKDAGHPVLTGRALAGEELSSTWVGGSGEDVLEVYESGLTILTEIPEFGSDPDKYYAAVVEDASRDSVFITQIEGVTALAVEPNTDKLGTNPGVVRFAHGEFSIVVSGPDMSVEYLSLVAGQLEEVPG